MEIPQIKDKVTVRAFALEVARNNTQYIDNNALINTAKLIEKYIIGDANLPEVYQDPLTTPFTWTTEPIQPLTVRYRHETDSQQL